MEPRGHMLTSSHMVTLLALVNMVKYSHDGSVASQNSVYFARPLDQIQTTKNNGPRDENQFISLLAAVVPHRSAGEHKKRTE